MWYSQSEYKQFGHISYLDGKLTHNAYEQNF